MNKKQKELDEIRAMNSSSLLEEYTKWIKYQTIAKEQGEEIHCEDHKRFILIQSELESRLSRGS